MANLSFSYVAPPSAATALPRVSSGQFEGDTLTMNTDGLNSVTAQRWIDKADDSVIATGATFDTTGHAGKHIAPQVDDSAAGSNIEGPAVLIYMAMMPSHDVDDIAALALVPHDEATHIAVADGDWSNTATWLGGDVPTEGARWLVPAFRSVTYDVSGSPRFDVGRIDGTLSIALDQSTDMLVETLFTCRGGTFNQGTDDANRLPAQYNHTVTFSGRDYRTSPTQDSDIDLARDTKLLGRGFINLGAWNAWGFHKRAWTYGEPVLAGATSITLTQPPDGWAVGDEIVIGGTAVQYIRQQVGGTGLMEFEDETRTITAINGNEVSWSGGLTYDHDHQMPSVERTDLRPVVMLKGGRNITFTSEVTTPAHRRGHLKSMHMSAKPDLWDIQCIELGRTDKFIPAGVIDDNGDFKYQDGDSGQNILTEPLTAASNLLGRYSLHFHRLGFVHPSGNPSAHDCYVEGTPGWGYVHHGCRIDMFRCVAHRFWGAGMVSEDGSELGGWVDCLSLGTSYNEPNEGLGSGPKILSGAQSNAGNTFRVGFGFGARGRAMRMNGCVAVSCYTSHMFFHRQDATPSNLVSPIVNPSRLYTDLKEVNQIQNGQVNLPENDWINVNYPILHIQDSVAIACMFGLFVSKSNPRQSHDVNIVIDGMRGFGCKQVTLHIEYVMTYILRGADIVAGKYGNFNAGVKLSGNVYQAGVVHSQIEGFNHPNGKAISIDGLDVHPDGLGSHNNHSPDDPRFFFVGNEIIDCSTEIDAFNMVNKDPIPDVSFMNDDFDNTLLDETADPSESYPLVIDTWTGSSIINQATNADGRKTDNISNQGRLMPKLNGDNMVPTVSSSYSAWRGWKGYWQYGGNDVLRVPYVISDRLTGRPHKLIKLTNITASASGTDNGALSYAGTAVDAPDIEVPVAANGSVTLDVLAGATGGSGSYALDLGDFLAPNRGELELDAGTGEITYTPDALYKGDDEARIFIESQNRFKTRRIRFLVNDAGTEAAVETPVVNTHVSAAAHADANTIALTLSTRPDTDERRIRYVQYQTDDNGTWRRACYHWRQGVTKITVASDGTAITAGSYNVKVRYVCAYDDAVSAESANMAVVIS